MKIFTPLKKIPKNKIPFPLAEVVSAVEPLLKHGIDGKDGIQGIDGKNGKGGLSGKDGKDGKDAPELDTIIDNLISVIDDDTNGILKKKIHEKINSLEILTQEGPQGLRGPQGFQGPQGDPGLPPEHQIDVALSRIRFRNPTGSWGSWIDLKQVIINEIRDGGIRLGGGGGSGNGGGNDFGIKKNCIDIELTLKDGQEMITGGSLCFDEGGTLILEGDATVHVVN